MSDMWSKPAVLYSAAGLGSMVLMGIAGRLMGKAGTYDPLFCRRRESPKAGVDVVQLAKWLGAPVLLAGGVTALSVYPQKFMDAFPAWFSNYVGLNEVLPLHPKNLHEAFLLGRIAEQVKAIGAAGGDVTALLVEAAKVGGRAVPATLAEMSGLEEVMKGLVDEKGAVSRMLGVFSLINIIWMFAILIVAVALGPVLWMLSKPIRRILIRIFTTVVMPVIKALRPYYQYLINGIAFLFFVESLRYSGDPYSMTGVMMCMTGLALSALGFIYTTKVNAPKDGDDARVFIEIVTSLIMLKTVPMAYVHQSSLLGMLSVFGLVTMVGFSFISYGCCYCVGFRQDRLMMTTITCGIINLLFTFVKATDIDPKLWKPFAGAATSIGGSVYMLSQLILADAWYLGGSYLKRQIPFLCSTAAFYVLGTQFATPSLVNVAHVYTVLYMADKYGDLGRRCKPRDGAMWFYILGAGLGMYGAAMYLNRNPGMLMHVLTGGT
eukprot:Hpha_TRINITY_DN16341_c1_g17::TRINITY_DN16341_c1_g17_i1::g.59787::m.59787